MNNTLSKYKLLIKTHLTTGLKYLCITSRPDPYTYKGSGRYWLNHLKTYGENIKTELVFCSDDYAEFKHKCNETSDAYDVARSPEWANLCPEYGYDSDWVGSSNLTRYWESLSPDDRAALISKRNKTIKETHWTKNPEIREAVAQKLSTSSKEYWKDISYEDKCILLHHLWTSKKSFWVDTDKVNAFKKIISQSVKGRWKNASPEDRKRWSRAARNARLNLSKEKQVARKEKIQEVYATGKHDKLFARYKRERRGAGNPMAKAVVIDGVRYGSCADAYRDLKISSTTLKNRLKSKDQIWSNWIYEKENK